MSKRGSIQYLWPMVIKMREAGKPNKIIAEELGLPGERSVENLLYRERRRQREAQEMLAKNKSFNRRLKDKSVAQLEKENKQLRMEVDLLRAFHREVGRG